MARWLAAVVFVIACHHGGAPPPAASCVEAADHILSLLEPKDAHAKKIRDVFATRCTTDAWSSEARECVLGTTSLHDPHHCKQQLSPTQRSALEHDLDTSHASDDGRLRALPEPCTKYSKLLDKVAGCTKLPQSTRDAFAQVLETMVSVPDEQRANLAQSCTAALDSLSMTATAAGCAL